MKFGKLITVLADSGIRRTSHAQIPSAGKRPSAVQGRPAAGAGHLLRRGFSAVRPRLPSAGGKPSAPQNRPATRPRALPAAAIWLRVLPACLCALAFTGCAASAGANASAGGKVAVTATFNAMAELVRAVGGDKVAVTTIIPDGTEPHDFEPKAKDLAALSGAKVFVYNGLGMESWAAEAVQAAGGKSLVAVEASKGAAAIKDPGLDPHLWLSVKGGELEAANIRDGLIQADPQDKAVFSKNYDALEKSLEALYNQYKPVFASAKDKNFVAGHAAFSYFCRDFGLTQQSVEDVYAEGEPSSKKLAELVDFCRKNHVKTIFAEQLASPAVSKTLAGEVGAQVKTIYTMESSEDGKTYLQRMADNISEIAASLH